MGLDPASAAKASASLAPGFRFHPTDEELVGYYLKRKLCGKPFRFDAISEIDIYKSEPWDLPGKSKLKSRDLEWYFFSALDKKYGNGWRTNRATNRGYWKTTGKDRAVFHKSRTIGMKKTLVFHSGRAPKGERTNWVMHEYKLVDEELEKIGIVQDAFVLCRIFHKSGSGPKNGEQYGAPLVEDEWDDEKLVMVPGEECAEEVAFGEDACLDGNDLEQILEADFISEDVPLPLSFYYEDNSNHVQEPEEFADDDQKFLVGMDEIYRIPELPDGQNLFDLPVENDMYTKPVRHEYIGEPSNTVDSVDADYLLDSPFLDAIDNTQFDGAFLETNDLSNPVEADTSRFGMLEEDCLTFFDTDVNNSQYMSFDSSKMMGNVKLDSDKASLIQKSVDGGAQQEPNNDFASTSKQEPANLESDVQYPFIKQASCMLGGIPDPFVFSSDFPSKDAVLRSNSTSRSSNSIHVTAGMIQIQNMTLSGNGKYCSLGKHTNISIILSFGVSQTDGSSASLALMADILLGKPNSAILWGWFYLILISVLILLTSFKMGNCIYTGNAS